MMRFVSHNLSAPAPRRHLAAFSLALFIILFLVYLSPHPTTPLTNLSGQTQDSCPKIPPSLAAAIIHYATTNVTPQQTFSEISVTAAILRRKSPCNFLVFGLGHDSPMWSALNHGGRTVFLEEDDTWIRTVRRRFRGLEAYRVSYNTTVSQARLLLPLAGSEECTAVGDMRRSECPLALKDRLPSVFYEVEWDVIMVDAPTGYSWETPGRMSAIYAAGMSARGRQSAGETDVLVHDVDRAVEDLFSMAFLCEGYLREAQGRLRRFTIPSHRAVPGMAFCPAIVLGS